MLLISRFMLSLVFDAGCRKYVYPDVTTFNMFCNVTIKTEFGFEFVAISVV